MSIIFAWLAPHALSLIMPVIVVVAAEANEHSPPAIPIVTKYLQMPLIMLLGPTWEILSTLTTSLEERGKLCGNPQPLPFFEKFAP
jgi:hypothetical protein